MGGAFAQVGFSQNSTFSPQNPRFPPFFKWVFPKIPWFSFLNPHFPPPKSTFFPLPPSGFFLKFHVFLPLSRWIFPKIPRFPPKILIFYPFPGEFFPKFTFLSLPQVDFFPNSTFLPLPQVNSPPKSTSFPPNSHFSPSPAGFSPLSHLFSGTGIGNIPILGPLFFFPFPISVKFYLKKKKNILRGFDLNNVGKKEDFPPERDLAFGSPRTILGWFGGGFGDFFKGHRAGMETSVSRRGNEAQKFQFFHEKGKTLSRPGPKKIREKSELTPKLIKVPQN